MIGPGGKLIHSITAECGDVNIRFPQDNVKTDVITIRGTKEDVEKAKVRQQKQTTIFQRHSFQTSNYQTIP